MHTLRCKSNICLLPNNYLPFENLDKMKGESMSLKALKKSVVFHSCFSMSLTIISRKKDLIQKKLREKRIETNQVHFRNDRYSIFKKFVKGKKFPNMNYLENRYLVLPVHHKVTVKDAKFISKLINKFAK